MKKSRFLSQLMAMLGIVMVSVSGLHAVCDLTTDTTFVHDNRKPFVQIYSVNMRGDLLMIGNQNICRNTADGATCLPPDSPTASNNDYHQNFVNVDTTTTTTGTGHPLYRWNGSQSVLTNSPSAIYNSSMMRLDLKTGDVIKWARLYWTGRNGEFHNCDALAKNTEKAKTIKFRTPYSKAYVDVVAEDNASGYYAHTGSMPYVDYGYSADVTALVQAGGAGEYYGANITTLTASEVVADIGSGGSESSYTDMYGSWMLLVVVENVGSRTLNNISIYDGYQVISGNGSDIARGIASSVKVTASGFLTPSSGPVKSNLFVYAGETDPIKPSEGSSDDQATVTNALGVATQLMDGANTPNDVMNSSFYVNGVARSGDVANPSFSNLLGSDIDVLTVSNLSNSQTNTDININSVREYYTLNAFAFETQLYEPLFCYDYTLKQDGHYLTIDRTDPSPKVSQALSSSPLELLVYLKNKEADIYAQGISLKADVNSSRFGYLNTDHMYVSNPNGAALIDRGTPNVNTPANCAYNMATNNGISDPGCVTTLDLFSPYGVDDTVRLRKGNGQIGSNEYIYTKFILQPKGISGDVQSISEPLDLSLDYYININGTIINYTDYTLGTTKIPMCVVTSGYYPILGRFNVVDRGSSYNNIETQISRKPFDMDVVLDVTPTTGDNNTTSPGALQSGVLVEIVDADTFGNLNALCANPDANATSPIFVPITSTRMSIPTQTNDYYNMALKNGAFRIWQFTDSNNTLLQNWSVTTTNNGRTVTGVNGLYRLSVHPACASACSPDTTVTCFECIKTNYAKPICSRDNFSIRPEAFDIRINDVNQTDPTKKLQLLSYNSGYTPDRAIAQPRINLAAGYNYGYDINATGHDASSAGFKSIPGYTVYYSGVNSDHNVTMLQDFAIDKTKCNDITNRSLNFYMVNGSKVNQLDSQDQVGEYALNMIDTSWTAVDQSNHAGTTDNGFSSGVDCILGSDATTDTIGQKQGCVISSAHTQGALNYKNQKVTYYPYKMDLSGVGYTIPTSVASGGRFVYDANLSNATEANMSVQATGQIKALGADSGALSNFVTGCYAQDVNLSISHNATTTLTVPFVYRALASSIAGVQSYDSGKINATANVVNATIAKTNFSKIDKGAVEATIGLNFDRAPTTPLDPQIVRYRDINGSCPTCSYSADGVTKNATGTIVMDLNVTHVYGRIGTQDVRASKDKAFNVPAYYEVYRTPVLLGQNLTADRWDSNWYLNKLHATESKDGNMSVSFVLTGGAVPTGSTYDNQGTKNYTFPAYGTTGAYIGHIKTSPWLWYGGSTALSYLDPVNPSKVNCATHPCFNIVVGGLFGSSGSAQAGSETTKGNKNSSNSGTWHSTTDYAPAIR
jgi:hypothetical protein